MTSRASESRHRYAIAGAGPVARSLIGKLPRANDDFGPVIGVSFRVASRIANALRAGEPARSPVEVNPCRTVLLHAPADQIAGLLEVLLSAQIEWNDKALVFCDCDGPRVAIERLQSRGASVAAARDFGISGYLAIEGSGAGSGAALAAAHRLAKDLDLRPIEIPPGAEQAFRAALTLANGGFTPLIDRVAGLLRHSGVRDTEAPRLAAALFQKTAADYIHSGRQSWSWHSQNPDVSQIEAELGAVANTEGDALSQILRQLILLGLSTFEKHPEALQALTPPGA